MNVIHDFLFGLIEEAIVQLFISIHWEGVCRINAFSIIHLAADLGRKHTTTINSLIVTQELN